MYARVAMFQGDPAELDEAISRVRGQVESGKPPAGLEGAKMLMLVDRTTRKGLGVTLFESEEALRRGDEALNAMPGGSGTRTSVEFYEVPVHTLGGEITPGAADREAGSMSSEIEDLAVRYGAARNLDARATQMHPLHIRSGEGKALWGPGDMYTFLVTGEQSGGACFAMEALVPGGGGPPPHIHDREDETLYILEGQCEVEIGDERLLASAGDLVWMPKGTMHRFRNMGSEPMRMILTFMPAGIELFFQEVFEAVEDRSAPPPPVSAELIDRLVTAAPRYGLEFVLPPAG